MTVFIFETFLIRSLPPTPIVSLMGGGGGGVIKLQATFTEHMCFFFIFYLKNFGGRVILKFTSRAYFNPIKKETKTGIFDATETKTNTGT